MIITGVRLCGRHLQLRRLLICNCEKLSISARLMQRLHHWPHQLPAGSELIRLLLLMGQRRRRERKGAALSINVPAAPPPLASDTGCSRAASTPPAPEEAGREGGTAAPRTASDSGTSAGMLQHRSSGRERGAPPRAAPCLDPLESCRQAAEPPMLTAERALVRAAAGSALPGAGEQTGSAAVRTHLAFAQVNFVAQPFRTAAVCLDGLLPQEPSKQVSSSSQQSL